MGTGNIFSMEPKVLSFCNLEAEDFVLLVIFSHIEKIAVRRTEKSWLGLVFLPLFLLLSADFFDIAEVSHFRPYGIQIPCAFRKLYAVHNGLEVVERFFAFRYLL